MFSSLQSIESTSHSTAKGGFSRLSPILSHALWFDTAESTGRINWSSNVRSNPIPSDWVGRVAKGTMLWNSDCKINNGHISSVWGDHAPVANGCAPPISVFQSEHTQSCSFCFWLEWTGPRATPHFAYACLFL